MLVLPDPSTLMAHEHPRGAGPFVGPQLRYLVGSAHGWLGGVGFAACARRLRARDAWIGWDDTRRRAHLHRVLGLCRLLVRPGVACRNLASHVLGRAARAVGDDCERLYGYRPWLLETFVDETEQTGASVRAANWVRVGETRGRGRQDRTHAASATRKAVYLYGLEPAWRDTLRAPAPGVAPLGVGDGLDAASWADHEFGGARLGDARLSARLVLSARQMAESPLRAMTGAANGTRAMVKGHYRLIDQPAESAVTVENILAPHRERTLRRMRSHDTVLCIQDGTRLNFTRRSQTEGLGVIGSNQTGAVARGLDLQTTLAVNPNGVALGVLRAAFDAPEPPNPEEKGQPKPRESRKSFRWVEGLRDCAEAAERLGEETRVVCTMDREADFLDLFVERRAHAPQVHLLVRAKVDRVLGQKKTADGHTVSRRLFDEMRNAPARGAATVEVRRLSARVKASKQPPKAGRAARVAEVTLRYQPVALPCPGTAPVEVFVIHAREEEPPAAVKPLEWFVLTTLRVTSADDAARILGWYALRWRIEEYFRVLKSGCKVEELQHHTAERLERAIAIKMVVGWRIQLMVQLGRETPEQLLQLLAGLEVGDALRRHVHPVAGPRVAGRARLAAPETEAAEAAEFDLLSPVQRLHDAPDHGVNDDLGALLRQAGGVGHLPDECRLRQVAVGHWGRLLSRGGIVATTRAGPSGGTRRGRNDSSRRMVSASATRRDRAAAVGGNASGPASPRYGPYVSNGAAALAGVRTYI